MSAKTAAALIVDDDPNVARLLGDALSDAGYSARSAGTVEQARAILEGEIDVILLDVNLPGASGLELLKLVRASRRHACVPVLLVTARGSVDEKVNGLDAGADDYLAKPFSILELLARVEALLRRARYAGGTPGVLTAGAIRVDLNAREAWADGARVPVTSTEFAILARLVERRGAVLAYDVLSESLSTESRFLAPDNVRWHMNMLRRKLGRRGSAIETLRGIGYRLKAE